MLPVTAVLAPRWPTLGETGRFLPHINERQAFPIHSRILEFRSRLARQNVNQEPHADKAKGEERSGEDRPED